MLLLLAPTKSILETMTKEAILAIIVVVIAAVIAFAAVAAVAAVVLDVAVVAAVAVSVSLMWLLCSPLLFLFVF